MLHVSTVRIWHNQPFCSTLVTEGLDSLTDIYMHFFASEPKPGEDEEPQTPLTSKSIIES